MALSGRGGGWFCGESQAGEWAGLEVGVGLNSGGALQLTPSLWGMQGVTERSNLNWLFGVSCMVSGLSSCIWEGSNNIIRKIIRVCFSM